MNEWTDKKTLDRILYDEQYRLKLGLFYLLATKEVIGIILFVGLVFDSGYTQVGLGGMAILFYYRFFFEKSRDGDQVDIFFYRFSSNLKKAIRRRAR